MPDSKLYRGRCLARRCAFQAEGPTEGQVEKELRDHVKDKHFLGAAIEIERPILTWKPEEGWRDAR